ncbi:MAG TPA: helix-turn-helix transcriptional regulator [Pseudomonadota bacterium]|nr:helix-turn-helix transcriptional regulator [Pseudomonadota bacterium]
MASPSAPAPPSVPADLWPAIGRHALALAEALRAIAPGQPPKTQAACVAYASLVDEIVHLSSAPGDVPPSSRLTPALTRKQLQDFGHLLRDKRNQAGFSRVQLARKAKLSDATIKFIETARHPPSRATLLRLVGVPELGLRWADTPGYFLAAMPEPGAETSPALSEAEFSRFDSRLTLPLVLEALLVLDELRTGQYAVEGTAYGARRLCCLCGARSEAWTLDAREAVKLPVRHAVPCAGRFADSLFDRFAVLSELAQEERRSLRSLTATALAASLRAIHRERFYGCRSGAEVAAQLARGTAQPATPYRVGVSAVLLWALGAGPCPVEPTEKPYSEPRAHQLARLITKQGLARLGEFSRLRGVSDAAAWLVDPQALEPRCEQTVPLPSDASQS